MSSYITNLKNKTTGDEYYPVTKSTAVYRADNETTVEASLNELNSKMAITVDPEKRMPLTDTISNNAITLPESGWLDVWATCASPAPTIPPVLRIYSNSGLTQVVAETVGVSVANGVFHCAAPLRKGCTYYLQAFRSTVTGCALYY